MHLPLLMLISTTFLMYSSVTGNPASATSDPNEETLLKDGDMTTAFSLGGEGSSKDLTLKNCSNDTLSLSESEYVKSPYEARLFDWISQMSDDSQVETRHRAYCNKAELCICHLEWTLDNKDNSSIWDNSDFLWDWDVV